MDQKKYIEKRYYEDCNYYQREVRWQSQQTVSKQEYARIIREREYIVATSEYGDRVVLRLTCNGYVRIVRDREC